jgi:chitodextrinase
VGASSASGYTILTTSAIQSASTKLADFVSHKQARGFNVQVVTESQWGGGTATSSVINIRKWLQDNYITDNILYVLLIGDPNPLTGDLAMAGNHSDFHYSNLTGDDMMWEVIVGRIPYFGVPADLDYILQKTMDYENEVDRLWRKNVLLPMVPYHVSTPNYQCGEQIKYDLLDPVGISSIRIYDEIYGLSSPPEYLLSGMYPATCWADNAFGMVPWLTHGWSSSASHIIANGDVPFLNDAYPSVTFQGSCGNSLPTTSDNISYNILKNGGIATVGAASWSYYYGGETDFRNTTSNGGLAYQFAKGIAEGQSCGEALANLREYLVPGIWENLWLFNVYGDPSVVVMNFSEDFTPPTPDPMTFDIVPNATSESTIAMEASVAGDTENSVEYHFTNTSGGGHNSGWQAGTFYEDSGLVPETQYTYTVTARDTSGNCNLTAPSLALSATTLNDFDPPAPATTTWASAPAPNFNNGVVENLVLPTNGGLLESFTSEYSVGWEAMNLTDTITYENGWCSAYGATPTPHEFIYSFLDGQEAILNEAIIYGGIADDAYYSEDVEVWTSTDGTTYTLRGSDTLPDSYNASLQLDLVDTLATNVKLVITSGYATGAYYDYWQLAEFEVNGYFSVPGDPETEITMTATEASDLSDVEYYFTETSGNTGGDDSGWQGSETYLDTGLTPGTQYCYTVTARDKSAAQNTTAASVIACATTTGDSPVELLDILADDIIDLDLRRGIENSLLAKIDAAIAKLEDDNPKNDRAAVRKLRAFINEVKAQKGKKISEEDADDLIEAIQQIIDMLTGE